jgi:hypothetical protein
MAALFPADKEMNRKGWECHPNPAGRLSQQPLTRRLSKRHADYQRASSELRVAWPGISKKLPEAGRFWNEFTSAVQSLPA